MNFFIFFHFSKTPRLNGPTAPKNATATHRRALCYHPLRQARGAPAMRGTLKMLDLKFEELAEADQRLIEALMASGAHHSREAAIADLTAHGREHPKFDAVFQRLMGDVDENRLRQAVAEHLNNPGDVSPIAERHAHVRAAVERRAAKRQDGQDPE